MATEATEIFGAYGSMPDSPEMHLMRGADITQIDAGTNEGSPGPSRKAAHTSLLGLQPILCGIETVGTAQALSQIRS